MVLEKYLVPRDNIETLIAEVRSDGYKMFRTIRRDKLSATDLKIQLPEIKISALSIADNSPLVGNSLARMEIRRKYEVLVLAIRRNSQIIANPDSHMQLHAKDELIALGAPDKISEFDRLIVNPK